MISGDALRPRLSEALVASDSFAAVGFNFACVACGVFVPSAALTTTARFSASYAAMPASRAWKRLSMLA